MTSEKHVSPATPPDIPTIIAIAVVAYAAANFAHEFFGHFLTGAWVGGVPQFISTTDVKGDWSQVSPAGYRLIAMGGGVVNLLLASASFVLLRAKRLSPTLRYFLWLFMVVNAFTAGSYMIVSPLFGFGDWNAFVRDLQPALLWRIGIAMVGLGLCLFWLRLSRRELAPFISSTSVAGGIANCLAPLFSPLGIFWAMFVAS
jgi:hypothetical protein